MALLANAPERLPEKKKKIKDVPNVSNVICIKDPMMWSIHVYMSVMFLVMLLLQFTLSLNKKYSDTVQVDKKVFYITIMLFCGALLLFVD